MPWKLNNMDSELLSICIPTRNRSYWLEISLNALINDIHAHGITPEVLKIYISDNCATDNTPELVRQFQTKYPGLIYTRNATNIGADRNAIHCPELAHGTYVWVMGDDDSILPGRLPQILDILRNNRLALFINYGAQFATGFKLPGKFANFKEFAQKCEKANPQFLLSHSLVSSNIFRTELFDHKLAIDLVNTFYGHMYGMIDKMDDKAGGVYVPEWPSLKIRNSSVDPIDGVWPANLEKSWREYLAWLKKKFDLKTLDPEKLNIYARRALFLEIKTHPINSVIHYAGFLKHKQTYKTLWKMIANK